MFQLAVMIPWTVMTALSVREGIQLVEDRWFQLLSSLHPDMVVLERRQFKYDDYMKMATVLEVTCWCWDA